MEYYNVNDKIAENVLGIRYSKDATCENIAMYVQIVKQILCDISK